MGFSDFNLAELYSALDAQRQVRGLSWAQATREISRQTDRAAAHGISASTVTGIRVRRSVEGDGVLQMLRWLNRSPESFVPGHRLVDEVSSRLPDVPSNKVLRFDTKKLHAALDAQRVANGMTWVEVAREMGLSAPMLTHLAKGKRIGFPHVMRMMRWLEKPAAEFTRASDW
jgi:hypothetical protein